MGYNPNEDNQDSSSGQDLSSDGEADKQNTLKFKGEKAKQLLTTDKSFAGSSTKTRHESKNIQRVNTK